MFKLPVCPYCKTVYRYKDVKKNSKKSVIKCYHCKQEFKNSRKGFVVLALIVIIAAVLLNVFILNITSDNFMSVVPIAFVSIGAVLIGLLLAPFFIKYKK